MEVLRNRREQVAASSIKLPSLEMGLAPVGILVSRMSPHTVPSAQKKRAADKAAREHFMPNAAWELGIQ